MLASQINLIRTDKLKRFYSFRAQPTIELYSSTKSGTVENAVMTAIHNMTLILIDSKRLLMPFIYLI